MTAPVGRDLTIDTGRGPLPLYVATPQQPGPWPGVVVVHDAVGMTTDARNQADWLAGAGFLAVLPDLFRASRSARCIFSTFRDLSRGSGSAFEDIEAARQWLAGRADGNGRIGIIGFCLGGGFALALAPRGGYDAASVNYGTLPKDALQTMAGSCPVVGSYGGRDRYLRGAAATLGTALTAHGVPHDVKEYPDAGHGFINDHAAGEVPRLFLVLGRALPTAYHEPSAVDARRRITSFFDEHLRT